uniref:Uncharacterized protein n=1 Tax=Eptatretus burgeri TaxID=7764 RepID=A0A8C4PXY6_EPTBU
ELQQRNQNISSAWSRRQALDLKRRRRRKKRITKCKGPGVLSDYDHRWNELRQFFHANRNLDRPACNRPLPPVSQGKLEKNMERAVVAGDVDKAQELSDQLATRQVNEYSILKKKDKRGNYRLFSVVIYGFEAKKRWETKSNMGYM